MTVERKKYKPLMFRACKKAPREIKLEGDKLIQTVIFLPEKLHADTKEYCLRAGISAKALYADAIIDFLSTMKMD